MALGLFSAAWLSSPLSAQAAPITDTFQLKGAVKEWCQGNPKFMEALALKVTDGVTLTFIQDPLGTNEVSTIQATLSNSGSADFDAITLQGLALPSNKTHRTSQLVLFGTNPTNPEHFIAIRGVATFDKLGLLTKVTGAFLGLGTGTYTINKQTQSAPTECFDSGTITTGKKVQ